MTSQFSKLLKRFRKQSFLDRVVVSAFVIASVIYGGTKSTNGVPPRMNAPRRMVQSSERQCVGFNEEDLRRGFVFTGIGTNEVFDFTAPEGAVVCDDWQKFGAAEDWIYHTLNDRKIPRGTNEFGKLRIFSNGKIEALPRSHDCRWMPLEAEIGIVPEARWEELANRPSRFWMAETDYGSVMFTWQNVLLNRLPETPVSFQAEFWDYGKFVYRYDLSRIGANMISNIVCGAEFGADAAWVTNSLATNVTSLSFYTFHEDDADNPDRDGDGLTTAYEIFVTGTDPGSADTDSDGVSDADEIFMGTDPCNPDTDNDALTDGDEVKAGSNPLSGDSDSDGIGDRDEIFRYGSSPINADTDGDGIPDSTEIAMGTDPCSVDTDGDGLSDSDEILQGNMLVSSAIKDHGLTNYRWYYMLNAAVPVEAYDGDAPVATAMIDKDWRSLPESVRSSEWWKMFENSVNDGRRLLTWEDRFSGIQRAVNCYSETEDTLGNADENAWMITHLRRENYWAMQELNKGTILTSVLPDNIMNCEGGWGFNPVYDRYRRRLAIGSQGNVFRKSFNEVLENLSRKDMIEKPLFRPFDDRLLFTTNTVYPNVVRLVRSRILADGIPAKTFAAGANPIGNGKVSDNMNYANCKIQSIGWPRKDDRWRHSDIKNVAFIFNHVFFKKLVNGETK